MIDEQDVKPPSLIERIFKRNKPPENLRTVIQNYMDSDEDWSESTSWQGEHALIANILELSDLTAIDVMLPRADIVAMPFDIDRGGVIEFIRSNPLSRFPVYKESLDNILGTIHIKDLFLAMAPDGMEFKLHDLIREVPVISPSLPVLDVLHLMRQSRKHMMIVVDEYGGTDGLITAGDVIEAIIGQLHDEHAGDEKQHIIHHASGKIFADARLDIDVFEEEFESILSEEEREEADTLGGFIMTIAGRIPLKGEIITHDSGYEFEIVSADPRQIKRVIIRKN